MAKKKAGRTQASKGGASKTAKKAVKKAARKAPRAAAKPVKGKAAKKAARKGPKSVARTSPKKTQPKKAAPRRTAKPVAKATPRRPAKAVPKRAAKPAAKVAAKKRTATRPSTTVARTPAARAAVQPAPKAVATPSKAPALDRPRKTVAEAEGHGLPSSLDLDRHPSAARSGRKELNDRLHEHTSTSPALTAGDVDADWESAESVGDEAPGGDNPTPDQDVVDEIGRALGVEYDDDEELQGGDEIVERDRHRWELDPGSSDDFEDR